jgi:hypothetical protein
VWSGPSSEPNAGGSADALVGPPSFSKFTLPVRDRPSICFKRLAARALLMESLTLDDQDVERLLNRLNGQAGLPTATHSIPQAHAEPPARTRPPYRPKARRARSCDRHPEVQNLTPITGSICTPSADQVEPALPTLRELSLPGTPTQFARVSAGHLLSAAKARVRLGRRTRGTWTQRGEGGSRPGLGRWWSTTGRLSWQATRQVQSPAVHQWLELASRGRGVSS